jgi:hypothetical protein
MDCRDCNLRCQIDVKLLCASRRTNLNLLCRQMFLTDAYAANPFPGDIFQNERFRF